MRQPGLALASCAVLLTLAVLPGGTGRPAVATPEAQFLPDTTVLLRVDDRAVTARDFVETYFNSWAEYRPRADSAGRVQFLEQIVNKEVMGHVARRADRPLEFEDRVAMREHTERALSNVLYQRMVLDSVHVTDADLEALRQQYSCEKHLKHILFADQLTAERVRLDVMRKRINWKDAQRRYSKATDDVSQEGDMGWVARSKYEPAIARRVFDLEPGQISQPYEDANGVHIVLVAERRPAATHPLVNAPRFLRNEIRTQQIAGRAEIILARLREQAGLQYDRANIAWASSFFRPPSPMTDSSAVLTIDASLEAPHYAPEDTGRVLARWRDGQLTLRAFAAAYNQITPLQRQPAHTPDLFRARLDGFVLEPYRARLAIELGLDRDPLAASLIEKRREEIMVDHLYQDSIISRVRVPLSERKKYYEEHVAQFITYPTVKYAALWRATRPQADSVAARLRAGEHAEDILRADSARIEGRESYVRELHQNEVGQPFYKLLFEELKPGQVTVRPEAKGHGYWAVQSLSFDAGRQLSYQEAEHYVVESLENTAAEKLLKEFLERHKWRLRIETHPELVMRINLKDPTDTD